MSNRGKYINKEGNMTEGIYYFVLYEHKNCLKWVNVWWKDKIVVVMPFSEPKTYKDLNI